jgi:ubiquinone/menaquinone biosynthesis C-methylase UbiE
VGVRRRLRLRLFEALYGHLAPYYDRLSAAAFAGEWARWQAVALRFVDRAPVVEVGCGTGLTLASLQRAGVAAYGIDVAWPMLTQAQRRTPGRVIAGQAQRLPLRSASIGTLVSIFPTPYILHPDTWAEAARVLEPGGRFLVVDHGWLLPRDPLRVTLSAMHRLIYGHHGVPTPLPGAGRLLPALVLTERTPHGFVSVHVATRDVVRDA